MTKHNVITWMAAACIAFAAHAQRPLRWVADAAQTAPVTFDCSRGETLTFTPTLKAYGTTLTNYTASFQWQTNGMGGLFWSTNALVFAPSMDVGASRYRFWIRAESTNGVIYSAQGTINMLHAPGATINALPLPVQRLDFAAVSWTNAPWLLAELDPGIPVHASDPFAHALLIDGKVSTNDVVYTATVSRASSAYGWGNHAAAGYLGAAGGELNENATWVLHDLYLFTTYSVSGVVLSSPPFGISATINYPQDETGTVTFASREWTRDYVLTGAPPAFAGVPDVWTNMVWGSAETNATYRMSWDATNGTLKVEEILP